MRLILLRISINVQVDTKEDDDTAAAETGLVGHGDVNWAKITPDILQKRKSDALTFTESPTTKENERT